LLYFDNQQPDPAGGFHFCLFNNLTGTNFRMWCDDDMQFRFVMTFRMASAVEGAHHPSNDLAPGSCRRNRLQNRRARDGGMVCKALVPQDCSMKTPGEIKVGKQVGRTSLLKTQQRRASPLLVPDEFADGRSQHVVDAAFRGRRSG
jgi:hypothetical protein